MADTFAALIRRWPKTTLFAAEVGAPERSAREWLRTDSIPAAWFRAVVRAAYARGYPDITLELLAQLAEARREHGQNRRAAVTA